MLIQDKGVENGINDKLVAGCLAHNSVYFRNSVHGASVVSWFYAFLSG